VLKERATANSLGTKIAIAELRLQSIDPGPLLTAAGLDPDMEYGSHLDAPFFGQARFYELAAKALEDPFFGIRIAKLSDPFELGAISYVSLTSATFGDALSNFRRYLKLLSNVDVLEFRFDKDHVNIAGVRRFDGIGEYRQMFDSSAMYVVRFCARLTSDRIAPLEVRLPYEFSGDPAGHVAHFGCQVTFGHSRAQILFRREDLTLSLKTANTGLQDVLAAHCDALMRESNDDMPGFINEVRDTVARLLPRQRTKAKFIAAELGLTERTFQRKLSDLGFSFSHIRDEVRRDLAYKYLLETDEKIAHIAYILDYSSQSSFSSSFRRLTGKTPGEVRRSAATE